MNNDYNTMMRAIHGSFNYEFVGDNSTELSITGFFEGKETKIDLALMTEDIFDELTDNDTEYDDAIRILRSSKRYEFDNTVLIVQDYHTGDEVKLDLNRMTEDIFEEMSPEEELDDDFEEDFEDAVNEMDLRPGPDEVLRV